MNEIIEARQVTQEAYCRAETDRTFSNASQPTGGVNSMFSFRNVTPLDSQTVVRMNNADGTFRIHFGSKDACGDVPNRLGAPEGWRFLMRIYRPGQSVLNGSYKLPDAVACQ